MARLVGIPERVHQPFYDALLSVFQPTIEERLEWWGCPAAIVADKQHPERAKWEALLALAGEP